MKKQEIDYKKMIKALHDKMGELQLCLTLQCSPSGLRKWKKGHKPSGIFQRNICNLYFLEITSKKENKNDE